MLAQELQNKLANEFDLVCFEDLGDMCQQHRDIFDLFKRVRKDSFENNQRVVLYSSFMPEQRVLDHIQRAAARIDISNFFILIVTPFDLSLELSKANDQFGYDDVIIQSMILPVVGTKPLSAVGFSDYSSVCPLPFVQTDITQQGNTRPCCKFKGYTGNIKEQTLVDTFHNDAIVQIRRQMLNGVKPTQCSTCWKNESNGTASYRKYAIDKFGDQLDQGWLDDIKLRDLTISPFTLCNFKCRTCSENASSSIAAEKLKFSSDDAEKEKLRLMIKNDNDPVRSQQLIQSIGHIDSLEVLHILGGEPLLWPQLENLVDLMIDTGQSPNVGLELNTNGSIYPEKLINKIINNFKCLELLVSIDDVGQRFEIERGGTRTEIYQNLKNFAQLRSNKVIIKLAVTVNIQNVLYLDDPIQLDKKLSTDGILWWYLETPKFMCIDHMPATVKNAAYQKYHSHSNQELRAIAQRMLSTKPSFVDEFFQHMATLDYRRNQDWKEHYPELVSIISGG